MSLFAPVLIVAFLIALQGFLLQTACAVAGERPPTYGEALLTSIIAAIVAGLASTAFGCTFGVFLGLFSRYLAWFAAVAVGTAVTASVYRSRLLVPTNQALAIAIIHHVLAWAISGLLWALIRFWPF